MQPFEYIVPKDHAEASAILAAENGSARAMQGGTDLLIRIRGGFVKPEKVLDLKSLPGMREIRRSTDGWLTIGAACTMNQVADSATVLKEYGLLAQACNAVASYQLRNRATVGGNCCNASPAADTAPALLCLDAVTELHGLDGVRRVPLNEFFVGPGRTAMKRGEFLTGVHLPPASHGAVGVFNKLGRTKVGDISVVSVAVYAWPAADGLDWRIALGAVGPRPLRATDAEDAAAQATEMTPAVIDAVADLAARQATPITDIRASAPYRQSMVRVLARRGIEEVLTQLRAGQEVR